MTIDFAHDEKEREEKEIEKKHVIETRHVGFAMSEAILTRWYEKRKREMGECLHLKFT